MYKNFLAPFIPSCWVRCRPQVRLLDLCERQLASYGGGTYLVNCHLSKQRLGLLGGDRWVNDDILARLPVYWRGHAVLVTEL